MLLGFIRRCTRIFGFGNHINLVYEEIPALCRRVGGKIPENEEEYRSPVLRQSPIDTEEDWTTINVTEKSKRDLAMVLGRNAVDNLKCKIDNFLI